MLRLPSADNSSKREDYREHGTSIRDLLGQEGMRVIGRAFDLGIIKEETRDDLRNEPNQGTG